MAYVTGTEHGETLSGTHYDDVIIANGGNDTIISSNGRDYINGGAGQDTVDYSSYRGSLSIVLNGGDVSRVTGNGVLSDWLVNIENITGGSGDDYFAGDAANNTFRGNAGHDYFVASCGYDAYFGGCGYDMVDFSGIGTGVVIKPTAYGYSTVSAGGRVYDRLSSIENIIGTAFNDDITGDSSNNHFIGGDGNDKLSGMAGGDVLVGGAGNDILTGGRDADIFEFSGHFGRDVITDFDAHGNDHDFIDLSGVRSLANFDDMIADNTWQRGNDAIIDDGEGHRIILRNVDVNHLAAGDFIF